MDAITQAIGPNAGHVYSAGLALALAYYLFGSTAKPVLHSAPPVKSPASTTHNAHMVAGTEYDYVRYRPRMAEPPTTEMR